MKLICVFVFAYADCWFSDAAAHVTLEKIVGQLGLNYLFEHKQVNRTYSINYYQSYKSNTYRMTACNKVIYSPDWLSDYLSLGISYG